MGQLSDDILKWTLDVNGSPARKELTQVSNATNKLERDNTALAREMAKLEAHGKKGSKEWKTYEALIKKNSATITANKQRMAELRKEVGLNNLSATELRKEMRNLKQTMDKMDPNSAKWKKLNGQFTAMKGRLTQIRGGAGKVNQVFGLLKQALPIASVGALVAGLISAGKGLFNLTKQIQGETIRSTVVFGNQLRYVEEQADKVAKKMGVTNREFVSMAANAADLLIPLDFSRKKAAEMATQVQSLSGALDEWTAGKYGVVDISNILTKSMLGEMEELKKLGIAIRQDSEEYTNLVKQKELEEGATNAQARALATLELIYKKSADAQTAYEGTGNKLLRTQKSITLWWKNMKEGVANYLNTTANDRLLKQAEDLKSIEKQFENQNTTIDNLLVTYDNLKGKQTLTKDEQILLNNAIKKIGEIVPTAITEFNKYGEAVGINKDKIIEAREAQRLLNLEMRKDVVDDLVKNIEKQTLSISNANDQIEARNKLLSDEELMNKVITQSGLDRGTIENNNLLAIKDQNDIIKQNNKELAQTILKLKDIGLTEDEISQRSGVSVQNMTDIVKNYLKTVDSNSGKGGGGTEIVAKKSLIKVQEDLLEQAKKWPETTEEEIAAKNRRIEIIEKEIQRLKELGTVEAENKKTKDQEKAFEKADKVSAEIDFDNSNEIAAKAHEFDILKQMEKEFLEYQKQLDKEGLESTKKVSKETIEYINDQKDARNELTNSYISAAGKVIDTLIAMAGKESRVGKALFLLNQARAVGEVVFNTGIANAKAVAASPLTAGQPWVTINSVTAGASIAEILAQTISEIKGYATGGFANEEQYVVAEKNKPEWIAPNWQLNDPRTRRMIDLLEYYRQNPAALNIRASQPIKQFAIGGYSKQPDVSGTNLTQPYTPGGIDSETAQLLTNAIHEFMNWRPDIDLSEFKKRLDRIENRNKQTKLN